MVPTTPVPLKDADRTDGSRWGGASWNLIGRLGRFVLDPLRQGVELLDLLYACVKSPFLERGRGLGLVRRNLGAQVYFTAVQPLPLFLTLGLVSGWLLWLAIDVLLERVQNAALVELAPHLGVLILARELGPLVIALVLVARSATAVSTELGYMKVNREVEALEAQGMNVDYLVILPRVLGIALAAAMLSIVFAAASVCGGYYLALLSAGGSAVPEHRWLAAIDGSMCFWMLTKTTVFGMVIATIACHQGLSVRSSFTEIPRANVRTAVRALASCFVANALLTIAEILW